MVFWTNDRVQNPNFGFIWTWWTDGTLKNFRKSRRNLIFSRWSSSRKICCPRADDPENLTLSKKCGSSINCQQHENKTISNMTITPKIHTFLIFHINENVFYDLPLICDVSLRYVLRNILKANLFAVLSKSIVHVQVSLLFIFSRSLSQHLLTNGVYAEAQKLQNQILEQA